VSDTAVFYNPFAEGYAAHPYPHYAELREADPVHQTPFEAWFLFRDADVRRLLRDPKMSVDERNAHPTAMNQMATDAMGDHAEMINAAMLNVDAPQHTRLRRLVSKAFTPRMIERLRARLEVLTDEALDRADDVGGMDLMQDLAFTLPFTVITELLGMPETDTVELRRLSGTLVRSVEPVADPDVLAAILAAGVDIDALIRSAIDWKRPRMADDLLSALIDAEDGGDTLSERELVDQVTLLYIAGHETTVNLIGNGMRGLIEQPEQMSLLREDPSLDGGAIDELLRYDSPVQMTRRITRDEIQVGGKVIEPGAFVVLGLASANRDPDQWGPTADTIDIRRADAAEHVSFGGGHHFCLGAALARLEGQVAIGRLVRRFETIEPIADPTWNGRINLRGMSSYPLRISNA